MCSLDELPDEAVVHHLESEKCDDCAEYDSENFYFGASQEARTCQRSAQDAEHYWHREAGVDIAAIQVDAGAGGGGDADHEIAGGGGNFEGKLHGAVHGENFHCARANAQDAGQDSSCEHQAEASGNVGDVIGLHALRSREGAVEAEQGSDSIGLAGSAQIGARAD